MPDLTGALMIYDEAGHTLWLGSEDVAREAIGSHYGDAPGRIEDGGWMVDVGWDRFNYTLKREFVAETGFLGWWESCTAPVDGVETKKLRRTWRFVAGDDERSEG